MIDSNSHPTLSELRGSKIKDYYKKSGFKAALAFPIDLINSGSREKCEYIKLCLDSKFFIPVFPFDNSLPVDDQIHLMRSEGCTIIKIHPRFLSWRWTEKSEAHLLYKLIDRCARESISVMLCTYLSHGVGFYPRFDPLLLIDEILEDFPDIHLALMHAGGHRVLEFSEFARFREQIYLDLSYTILRFRGSSLTADINYVLRNYDRRILLGSDYPYATLEQYKNSLTETLSKANLSYSHIVSMSDKNIIRFARDSSLNSLL